MADELYLLKVHGNHAGQHSEMGLYYHGSNLTLGEVYDNAKDLIASWETALENEFLALMPESYYIERITARRIVPSGGVEACSQKQDLSSGGQSGPTASSNQLCPVVRLIPPMGTKSAGRFFLPAIAESDIAANIVSAGWTANLATFMGTFFSNIGLGAIVWLPAVYSTKNNTYVDAVTYDTSPTVGWQRRRDRPH